MGKTRDPTKLFVTQRFSVPMCHQVSLGDECKDGDEEKRGKGREEEGEGREGGR